MNKASLCFYTLFFTLFALLAGCKNEPEAQAPFFDKPQYEWGKLTGQTIVVRGFITDLNRPYLRQAFKRYEQLTGNTVITEGLSKQELDASNVASFISGTIAAPDILLSPGGTAIEALAPDSNFYNFTTAPWVDDLTDTALNQTISNGKVIGLPYWEASVSGTLYNKELFKKLGLEVPRNQEEFLNVCETLLRNGVYPVYMPFAEPSMMLYQFPMDFLASQPKILEGLNQGTLSYAQIPEMHRIVSWYKTMAERGYFGQNYLQNNWQGMDESMRRGTHAMLLCWDTWLYTDFHGDPENFGLMPAFMGVPEQGTFEGPNLMLLAVNKNSPRLEAALDLITFMADPYNYNISFANLYTAPVFKNQLGSISTPQYVQAGRLIDTLFHDSTARPRIIGFSQTDSTFILKHMHDQNYSVLDCLNDMDQARNARK